MSLLLYVSMLQLHCLCDSAGSITCEVFHISGIIGGHIGCHTDAMVWKVNALRLSGLVALL